MTLNHARAVRRVALLAAALALPMSAKAGPLDQAVSRCKAHAARLAGPGGSVSVRSIKERRAHSQVALSVRGTVRGDVDCRTAADGTMLSLSFKDRATGQVTDLLAANTRQPRS